VTASPASSQRSKPSPRDLRHRNGKFGATEEDHPNRRPIVATLITITDRDGWDARTDNIVLVEPARRRLLWLPRDLWSSVVGDRLNTAFARGGHPLLRDALGEYGFALTASICLRRSAIERALQTVSVAVPVERRLAFWYPLEPTALLEEGRKLVSFEPPCEILAGERLHQWIGARNPVGSDVGFPDLDRIERQKVLVRRLLEEQFRFASVLEDTGRVSIWNRRAALADLVQVGPAWRLETFAAVHPAEVGGKRVLLAKPAEGLTWLRGTRTDQ
jgi:hypothetical protein